MEVVKICNEKYKKSDDLKNVIRYATDPEKTYGLIGGLGVNPFNPQEMIFQMQMIKRSFEKEGYGRRQLRHFIVSFESEWMVSPKLALTIAYDIAKFYAGQYQISFGVHQDTDNVHIHFVQNTVSYLDGRMFSENWAELSKLKNYVQDVLGKYIPQCHKRLRRELFQDDCI